jgi:hypothetical protein
MVARMLAVILSARDILEWSAAAHVADTDVMAARNPRIGLIPQARVIPAPKPLVQRFQPLGITGYQRTAAHSDPLSSGRLIPKLIQTVLCR